VPKHKLLVMDMRFNTRKRRHKKFEPRICAWKLNRVGRFKSGWF